MNKKTITISIIAIIAAIGIGYSLPKFETKKTPEASEKQAEAPKVEAKEGHTEEGAEEGVVEISDNDAKSAGIETGKINFGTGSEIRILGRIMASPEAKIMVGVPISGRVSRVYVAQGSNVAKGSPLFEIISAEGAGVVADANAARANANAAQSAYSNDEFLYNKGVISKRDLENSRANAIGSNAYANAARAKISVSGNPSNNGALIVRSPINGVIGMMPISVGGFVAQGAMGGEITNVANTEAVFQIAPSLLEKITIGSNINIETTDGKQYAATIKAIAPGTDGGAANSVLRAKINGANLAVGTVLNARIVTQSGSQDSKPLIPSAAIIDIGDEKKVFVKNEHGFGAVDVIVGNSFNGQTQIIRGLKGDEIIAIKNVFLLKSELAKGDVGHDH